MKVRMRYLGIAILLLIGLAVLAFGIWAAIAPEAFIQTFWGEPERYWWSSQENAFVAEYAVSPAKIRGLGIMGVGFGSILVLVAVIMGQRMLSQRLGRDRLS